MKNCYTLFVLLILFFGLNLKLSVMAQYNFPSEADRPIWVESYQEKDENGDTLDKYNNLTIIGDTTIGDKSYKKVYRLADSVITLDGAFYVTAIRADNTTGKIYGIFEGSEKLVYDFAMNKGEMISYSDVNYPDYNIFLQVDDVDSIKLRDNSERKRIHFNTLAGPSTWIEGIGSIYGMLTAFDVSNFLCAESDDCQFNPHLRCYIENGEVLYKNCEGNCFQSEIKTLIKNPLTADLNINVFPNPAKNAINIKYVGNESLNFELVNIVGQIVSKKDIRPGAQSVNVSRNPSGVYFIILSDNNGNRVHTEKLIVK